MPPQPDPNMNALRSPSPAPSSASSLTDLEELGASSSSSSSSDSERETEAVEVADPKPRRIQRKRYAPQDSPDAKRKKGDGALLQRPGPLDQKSLILGRGLRLTFERLTGPRARELFDGAFFLMFYERFGKFLGKKEISFSPRVGLLCYSDLSSSDVLA
jgi:hypothetical protein